MKEFWFIKLVRFLTYPTLWLVCFSWLFTLAAVAGCVAVLVLEYTGVWSYIIYVFSALSLAYSVYSASRFAPRLKREFLKQFDKIAFVRAIRKNFRFRTLVFACVSFLFNVGIASFHLVIAFLTRTIWHMALAGYYVLLSVLRGVVFLGGKRAKTKSNGNERQYLFLKLKNYRMCGILLFVLEIAMSVAVTQMVFARTPTKYNEINAIIVAVYTCCKVTFAVINLFKAKNLRDPQVQAFRNIGLADAAISLLSLQIALVATFSKGGSDLTSLNAAVGACICIMTVTMGILMIAQATKRMKRIQKGEEDGNGKI